MLENRQYFANPVLGAIGSQTLPIGKPVMVPLVASDADGDRLSYTVSDNSGSVTTQLVPSNNTWLRMEVQGFGTMEFQLFNDRAPDTVRRISGLVQSGFYDGLTFHRILEDFVLQGGDPAGNGTGGPDFRFDDEFEANTLFTGNGQLAMANSGKDTNGSQFFVTIGNQRFLDFNHTVFGQLVRGFDVMNAIEQVPVGSGGTPLSSVVISRMSLVENKTDAVLQVRTTNAAGGTVTVTVNDGRGGTATRTFAVSGTADANNTPPVLSPVPADVVSAVNTPVVLDLASFDLEGDPVEYGAQFALQNGATGQIDASRITITPANNFTGQVQLYVGVKAQGANSRGSTQFNQDAPLGGIYDHQLVTISFGDKGVTSISGFENGMANGVQQKVLLASFQDRDANGKASDWSTTSIDWGDGSVDAGGNGDQPVEIVKAAGDGRMYIYGTHAYERAGTFPITINLVSNLGQKRAITSTILVREMATLSGNILFVNATSAPDTVGVSVRDGSMRVNVNGKIRTFPASSVGRVEIQAYEGNDVVTLGGGVPGTYIFGDLGDDLLEGGDGNDTLSGGAGKNTLHGHGGNDRLNGSGGRDYITGGAGDDRIYGNGGDDTLDGQSGSDRIWGGAGNDLIFGGGSNDRLWGEDGNDTLYGQGGSDVLDGGAGTDTADNDSSDTRISIEVLL
jgi:cyclophilin family peptidyl-prolyl cis-trans isomerase